MNIKVIKAFHHIKNGLLVCLEPKVL